MENGSSLVRVLGTGHLAAAVRLRLRHMGPHASDMDCGINSECAALFLACSDFENASLRRSIAERARADRSTLLFACLHGHSARVGPLITTHSDEFLSKHYLTRSWDFSRNTTSHPFVYVTDSPMLSPDMRQIHLAQIGATFIVRELANILDGVTKFDSPTNLSQWSPTLFRQIHAGTLVSTPTWPDTCQFQQQPWHPATPTP